MDFARRVTTPSGLLPFRLLGSVWRQRALTPVCPETPRLDGKVAVVTGGNAGIGIEIARGVAKRGAEVVIAARTESTATTARDEVARETGAKVHWVPLDLSDLRSVAAAEAKLHEVLAGRRVDVLVANAGLWPQAHSLSAQGHEIAFATNTLGHHALVRRLLLRDRLRQDARIVVVTGDIYVRASECTSDFAYSGKSGGGLAYSRSKLGNLWFASELQKRHPELEVCSVHPGVIASGLGGTAPEKRRPGGVMIDCASGAQAPLWCATQPIERGGYYHNTRGLMRLPPGDPAADPAKAAALWARLEELARPALE
jgi:NAD(P)-dependent dehydrogenase (short-subunit alcohol dehydrogenase family)